MYIIVIGGGKVGYYLAKSLIYANHEALIVEIDSKKCASIADELGSSVVMNGDGCEPRVLMDAGMARADVMIAVTGDDEVNLVACQLAKRYFNVPRTVARINNPKNEAIFKRLGIDATVSSTDAILAQIEQQLPAQALVHLLSLRGAGVEFLEVKITADSPALGKPLRDLGVPADIILPLVLREGKSIIPHGGTVLQAGDEVIAVTAPASMEVLRRLLIG
jgi:trk system potassium uptake protein